MFKYKKISLFFVVAIIGLSFCCVELVNASQNYTINDCEYTDEYVAWTKLSDEEKKNTQMPPICVKGAGTKKLQSDIKKSFDAFNKVKLPAKYDIRNTELKATMRDQMDTGSCWAFSTTTTLEIFAKKKFDIDQVYSARHIEYTTSKSFLNNAINEWAFNREVGEGGNNFISSAYLINQRGPVLEEIMPFENNEDKIDISKIQNHEVQLDVNGINLDGMFEYAPCSSAVITKMKEKVHSNGALVSSVHFTGLSSYYNPVTSALYYNGTDYSNHAITIVGWDDDYSANNFSASNKPAGNGAWIVQNSWGSDFGENGYNYVSYYDQRICAFYMSVEDVDTEVEDNIYVYDKLGHNISVGYQSASSEALNSGYGMAVFNKDTNIEVLNEITIGTIDTGSYKIYYAPEDASKSDISKMTLIGSGSVNYGGYLTHKLDNPIYMDPSVTKFSIAVKWTVDTDSYPIPVCNTNAADYFSLTAVKGQTFTSYAGDVWYDNYESGWIVSIKAFTDDVTYEVSSQVKTVNRENDGTISVDLELNTNNINKENLNMVVTDSNDDVIDDMVVTYGLDSNDKPISANLEFANSLDNGTYYISIYYYNNFIEKINFAVQFGLVSDTYKVSSLNKTVYISKPVQVSTFLSNIYGNSGGVTKSGTSVDSGYVGTGMMVDDYLIILRGDVTGDGQIKVNDVMKISQYTVEGTGLEQSYFKQAADVTGDNLVKVNDVMKISKYTVEGGTL